MGDGCQCGHTSRWKFSPLRSACFDTCRGRARTNHNISVDTIGRLFSALRKSLQHFVSQSECCRNDGTKTCQTVWRWNWVTILFPAFGSYVQDWKGSPNANKGTVNVGVSSPDNRTRNGSVPNRRKPSPTA